LALTEGQASDAWEPSKKESSFGNGDHGTEKYSQFFVVFKD